MTEKNLYSRWRKRKKKKSIKYNNNDRSRKIRCIAVRHEKSSATTYVCGVLSFTDKIFML